MSEMFGVRGGYQEILSDPVFLATLGVSSSLAPCHPSYFMQQ